MAARKRHFAELLTASGVRVSETDATGAALAAALREGAARMSVSQVYRLTAAVDRDIIVMLADVIEAGDLASLSAGVRYVLDMVARKPDDAIKAGLLRIHIGIMVSQVRRKYAEAGYAAARQLEEFYGEIAAEADAAVKTLEYLGNREGALE